MYVFSEAYARRVAGFLLGNAHACSPGGLGMTGRPLSIFVSHPSPFLTDSLPHGDGLIAHSILRRLADRGHTLHVAVPLSALEKAIPGDVRLYPLETMVPPKRHHPGLTYRVEYAI